MTVAVRCCGLRIFVAVGVDDGRRVGRREQVHIEELAVLSIGRSDVDDIVM